MRPIEIETKLLNVEEAAVDALNSYSRFAKILGLVVILILFSWLGKNLYRIPFPFLHFKNIAFAARAIFVVFAMSSLSLLINERYWPVLTVTAFLVGWTVQVGYSPGGLTVLSLSFFPVIAVAAYWFLSSETRSWWRAFGFFGAVVLVSLAAAHFEPSSRWMLMRKFNYYAVGVIVLYIGRVVLSPQLKAKFIFTPAHLALPVIFPMPERDKDYLRSDDRVWSSGLVQVTKSIFLFAIVFVVLTREIAVDLYARAIPIYTALYYVCYLLIAPAVGNMVTGIGRLYRFEIPDCSRSLWLAESPLDYLKRENVHAYKFSIRFFYFNFLKITRNPLVIAGLYTLIFPAYRYSFEYASKPDEFNLERFFLFFGERYFYWISFLVLIAATYRLSLFRSGQNRWRPIALTHALMFSLFLIYAYLWQFH